MFHSNYRLGPFGRRTNIFIDVRLESENVYSLTSCFPGNAEFEAFVQYAADRLRNYIGTDSDQSLETLASHFFNWIDGTTTWPVQSVKITEYLSRGLFNETSGEYERKTTPLVAETRNVGRIQSGSAESNRPEESLRRTRETGGQTFQGWEADACTCGSCRQRGAW